MSDKYTLLRYAHSGEKFEILVDPEKGLAYKLGELENISEGIVLDTVFTDAKKGERASRGKLESAFGTSDFLKIAEVMFKKGTLQLQASQRKAMMEQKLKQIINIISRNYVDPRTKIPHPLTRIQNALEEVHVSIDPFISAEEQLNDIIKVLRPILPLSIENVEIAVKIPPEYASISYGIAKSIGTIKREEWQSDGSWIAVITVPAVMQVEFLDRLGKTTQGNLQTKIIR